MDKIMKYLDSKYYKEGEHPIRDKYKKLETDEERIIFTYEIMLECDAVPKVTVMPKNANESEKLREQGNEVFVKAALNNIALIEALKLYTKSIAFAPYQSKQLALAYANRSEVLFQLGLHSECIQDIDRALALDYPDDLRAKLYVCKTECLMILGNCSIEDILKEARYWLDKMSLNDTSREKLRAKLDILHHKTAQTELHCQDTSEQTQMKKSNNEFSLPIVASHNDEVLCASDAVAIRYNERYGRHIVTTRHIHPNEVIAVEKPYSLILTEENMQTHCSNCLRVCWANVPCNYCTYAMYCSEECRYTDWIQCHDVECSVFSIMINNRFNNIDLFSIRLAILAVREAGSIEKLRAMLKEVDECDDPRTKGFSKDGKLHSDKYIGIYSLMTNTENRSILDLFKMSFNSCIMLYILATRTAMFGSTLPDDIMILAKNKDVTFFGSLIMRHEQIIRCNAHYLQEWSADSGILNRGIAVMPFFSLINHSCNSNVMRQSRPKHMVMYALYPIQKGEQLFISYGDRYVVVPRAKRQQNLLNNYFFTCDCIPCHENWPLRHELQSFKTLVKKNEDKAKIEEALLKFNIYLDLATEGNVQGKSYIIEDLVKMVQTLYDCAPMPCKEMIKVIGTLRRVYAFNGNIFEIPKIWTYKE